MELTMVSKGSCFRELEAEGSPLCPDGIGGAGVKRADITGDSMGCNSHVGPCDRRANGNGERSGAEGKTAIAIRRDRDPHRPADTGRA